MREQYMPRFGDFVKYLKGKLPLSYYIVQIVANAHKLYHKNVPHRQILPSVGVKMSSRCSTPQVNTKAKHE